VLIRSKTIHPNVHNFTIKSKSSFSLKEIKPYHNTQSPLSEWVKSCFIYNLKADSQTHTSSTETEKGRTAEKLVARGVLWNQACWLWLTGSY